VSLVVALLSCCCVDYAASVEAAVRLVGDYLSTPSVPSVTRMKSASFDAVAFGMMEKAFSKLSAIMRAASCGL